MRLYLEEAALLATETSHSGCPVTSTAQFLDHHPAIRLVLEDTWSDSFGRIYREIPAEHQSRWPSHLARCFRILLRIGKNPAQVFRLLDLLHEIDANQSVIRMVIAGCRKRESLDSALEYFENLASELRSVTEAPPEEEDSLGVMEPRCRTRRVDEGISADSWYLPKETEPEEGSRGLSSCYRPDVLHDPDSTDEGNWIDSQPQTWRNLYRAIRKADADRLVSIREHLLFDAKSHWNHDQLQVLWTAYHLRRDKIRRQERKQTTRKLGSTARKLILRVLRIRSEREAGWVGFNLHRAMKGEVPLPGKVSDPEWSVVFEAYRKRKTELIGPPCQSAPSLRCHPVQQQVPCTQGCF